MALTCPKIVKLKQTGHKATFARGRRHECMKLLFPSLLMITCLGSCHREECVDYLTATNAAFNYLREDQLDSNYIIVYPRAQGFAQPLDSILITPDMTISPSGWEFQPQLIYTFDFKYDYIITTDTGNFVIYDYGLRLLQCEGRTTGKPYLNLNRVYYIQPDGDSASAQMFVFDQ